MQYKKILVGAIVLLGLSVSAVALNGTFNPQKIGSDEIMSSDISSVASDTSTQIDTVSSSDVSSNTASEVTVLAQSKAVVSAISSQVKSNVTKNAKVVSSFEGITEPGTYTLDNGIIMTIHSSSQLVEKSTDHTILNSSSDSQ